MQGHDYSFVNCNLSMEVVDKIIQETTIITPKFSVVKALNGLDHNLLWKQNIPHLYPCQ